MLALPKVLGGKAFTEVAMKSTNTVAMIVTSRSSTMIVIHQGIAPISACTMKHELNSSLSAMLLHDPLRGSAR